MAERGIAATHGAFMARLNAEGLTDDEIADVLGVTQVTACLARRKLGLPPVVRGRDFERFRRTQQKRFERGFERLNGQEPADTRTPLRELVAREEAARALGRLASMGSHAREVAAMRAEGLSLAEIGRRLGISREAVRQLWARARRRAL